MQCHRPTIREYNEELKADGVVSYGVPGCQKLQMTA